MVQDPYKTLNLPHSASADEVKKAYRRLAMMYHPDRCDPQSGDGSKFSELSAAYAILSDPQRKAQYDHIYKYGGFDETEESKSAEQQHEQHRNNVDIGVGYTCNDPFLAYVLSQGRIRSTKNLVGLQIPSRLNGGSNGFRFAVSSGQCFKTDPVTGARTYTSQTGQFSQGQIFTRTEKHILHNDGRKEVVVVDKGANGDQTQHYFVKQSPQEQATANRSSPNWYREAWHELQDKLSMCYRPCSAVLSEQ